MKQDQPTHNNTTFDAEAAGLARAFLRMAAALAEENALDEQPAAFCDSALPGNGAGQAGPAAPARRRMSRGPGKWQRLILDTLKEHPCFYAHDLLPRGHTRAEYTALLRAVRDLEVDGRAACIHWLVWAGRKQQLTVCRPGYNVSNRDSIPRLSVDKITS